MSSRQYGKLPIANWRDPDWLSHTVDSQWLNEFLVSQPTTDGAGVFPIQTRKWSKGAVDMTVERINAAAKLLVERGRIVVDHDTEEGLLRSFIRDDNAGSNIFVGQLNCALQVQSPVLRAVLLDEISGLDREFTVREQKLIDALEASIPVGINTPTSPSPSTATDAFEPPSNHVETPSERRSNGVPINGRQHNGSGATCPICPEQKPAGLNGMCNECSIELGHPIIEGAW